MDVEEAKSLPSDLRLPPQNIIEDSESLLSKWFSTHPPVQKLDQFEKVIPTDPYNGNPKKENKKTKIDITIDGKKVSREVSLPPSELVGKSTLSKCNILARAVHKSKSWWLSKWLWMRTPGWRKSQKTYNALLEKAYQAALSVLVEIAARDGVLQTEEANQIQETIKLLGEGYYGKYERDEKKYDHLAQRLYQHASMFVKSKSEIKSEQERDHFVDQLSKLSSFSNRLNAVEYPLEAIARSQLENPDYTDFLRRSIENPPSGSILAELIKTRKEIMDLVSVMKEAKNEPSEEKRRELTELQDKLGRHRNELRTLTVQNENFVFRSFFDALSQDVDQIMQVTIENLRHQVVSTSPMYSPKRQEQKAATSSPSVSFFSPEAKRENYTKETYEREFARAVDLVRTGGLDNRLEALSIAQTLRNQEQKPKVLFLLANLQHSLGENQLAKETVEHLFALEIVEKRETSNAAKQLYEKITLQLEPISDLAVSA